MDADSEGSFTSAVLLPGASDAVTAETKVFRDMMIGRLEKDSTAIESKLEEMVEFLNKDQRTHAISTVACSEHADYNWQFADKEMQYFTDGKGYGKHMICLTEIGRLDCSFSAVPLAGFAGALVSLTGPLSVLILTPEDVESVGSDLPLWLSAQTPERFEKNKLFSLDAGEGLWMPFGSIPLIVGLAQPQRDVVGKKTKTCVNWPASGTGKVKTMEDFRAYAFVPCFNSKEFVQHKIACKRLVQHLSHSTQFIPKSMANHTAFLNFKQTLDGCLK